MGWVDSANSEGPSRAERIPSDGVGHVARIAKVVHHKNGQPMQSQKGDPQMLLVFQDELGREASQPITLSESAQFVLAKILAACDPPVNIAQMDADGVPITNFANPEWADNVLLNRQLTIRVDPDSNNPNYTVVTPIPKRGDASVPPHAPSTPPVAAQTTPQPQAATPPAQAATTPQPPPSAVPPAPPPQTTPPTPITKDEAWRRVWEAWAGNNPERIIAVWNNAIKEAGKHEADMDGTDWAVLADRLETPF